MTVLKPHLCEYAELIKLTNKFDHLSLNDELIKAATKIFPDAKLSWIFKNNLFEFGSTESIAVKGIEHDSKFLITITNNDIELASIKSQYAFSQPELDSLKTMVSVYFNLMLHIVNSKVDQLTGVYNRQAFSQDLTELSEKLVNDGRRQVEFPKYLALLDLDYFKLINDQYGHLLGDEVLVTFGQKMRETFRDYDKCYRYGGEEFAVILNHVKEDNINAVLSRFKENIANHTFPQVGKVTVSIGYSIIEPGFVPSELMGKVDKALYYSKNNGRNCVSDYAELLRNNLIQESHHSNVEFW